MLTPNMSDEELDELVRRSAEAYPEEIPLGNWLRMEEKLNKVTTDQLVRRKVVRLFVLEVAVLALLLLLWQGYRMVNPSAKVARQSTSAVLPAASNATAASTPASSTQPTTSLKSSVSTAPLAPMAPKSFTNKEVSKPALIPADQTTSTFSRRLAATRRRAGAYTPPLVSALTFQKRQVLAAEQTQGAAIAGNTSALRKEEEWDSRQHRQINSPLAETAPTSAPSTPQRAELAQQPALPATATADNTHAQKLPIVPVLIDSTATKRPERPAHRLIVGVLVAPSFSAVRRLETARFGNNLGVTLEYRLTSRLRVRTALTRSIKNYGVASSDYTIPDSWQWWQGDYEVNADCRVTEIPVDLRYDVVSRPTYTVFAGVGLTSLLMRYECYDYDYQVNGQPRTAVEKVYKGKNHVFGLLNVSGGVERPLGSRWSVQAEPFLQLPLGSVGTGKVRLTSAGAAFSVKYGLLR
ncbi:hypothetical protein [uncultured Hymenobacter sp.]|uniref:hypothetical protein n=1 Tax=uncultured Hymenobacter sp. TaxID=170016 RepID=UPI0035CAC18E